MKVLATGRSKIQTHLNMYVSPPRSGTRKESSVFRTIRRSPRLVANGAAMVSHGKHSLTRESVLFNHMDGRPTPPCRFRPLLRPPRRFLALPRPMDKNLPRPSLFLWQQIKVFILALLPIFKKENEFQPTRALIFGTFKLASSLFPFWGGAKKHPEFHVFQCHCNPIFHIRQLSGRRVSLRGRVANLTQMPQAETIRIVSGLFFLVIFLTRTGSGIFFWWSPLMFFF